MDMFDVTIFSENMFFCSAGLGVSRKGREEREGGM